MGEKRRLLDVTSVAERLGVNRKTLYGYVERGHLPPEVIVRIGSRVYFRTAALDRWLGEYDPELSSR